jgi:hypothetical protein
MAARTKTGKKIPKAGGDVITVDNRGDNSAIAAGRDAKAVVSQTASIPEMEKWRKDMEKQIEAVQGLLPADKADLKDNVAKVAQEVSKGKKANPGRLERLFNAICGIAPDIFEVTLATLKNPLAGIGVVVKLIEHRARVEMK